MTTRPHSRLRRWTLCLFGHLRGEAWYRVRQGHVRERLDMCSRCGVRVAAGRMTL